MKPRRRKSLIKISALTRREREMVRLVANGLRDREIARKLDVAEASVRSDLRDIFRKLDLSGRMELILYFHSRTSSG